MIASSADKFWRRCVAFRRKSGEAGGRNSGSEFDRRSIAICGRPLSSRLAFRVWHCLLDAMMWSFSHAMVGTSCSGVRELRNTDESLSELHNSLMHVACRPWAAHLLRLPLVICLKEETLAMGVAPNGAVFFVGLRVVLGSAQTCGTGAHIEYLQFQWPQLIAGLRLGMPGTRGAVTVCHINMGQYEDRIFWRAHSMNRAADGAILGIGAVLAKVRECTRLSLRRMKMFRKDFKMPGKTILFASDYSPASHEALDFAASLARERGATLLIAHVSQLEEYPVGELFDEAPRPSDAELDELNALTVPDPRIRCEHRLLHGDAAEQIVALARQEQVETIVVGARGGNGFVHWLAGSVADAVLRQAPCEVIAYRPPELSPQDGNLAKLTSRD